MMHHQIHRISDRQALIEHCDSETGQYFIGMVDLDEPTSNADLQSHAFTLMLVAGLVFGVLAAIVLAVLVDHAFWRIF